ncbi:WXG100-like domain-containing protein [Streptomyces sp. NPDC004830]
MSLQASPEVNAMIFILTGEKLIDADEDLAYDSRKPYSGLGRKIDRLSSLIDKSIHDIAESMPDDLSKSYAKAMGMLVDDGGKNYLREFAEQLDKIAEGRRKTSMDIMESKWQVIAEVIRLLIEIAIYLAMSFFTGGASASQIMMAKLRSRFMILTTLSHLLQRLHLAPSLTEAFAEAFTTFAVRLAMMNFAPNGRRPGGFDWNDILKSAAFGAAAGFLTSVFDDFAKSIVRSYDNNFLKNGPDLDFKNGPGRRDVPDIDTRPAGGPHRDHTPDGRPGPDPSPNGPTPHRDTPTTYRDDPLSFRNNPGLWRNNRLLRHNADRPGALAGHYGLKGTADFLAAGSGEALAEILIKGAFDGDWSTSWSTFVGAGISSQVEATLTDTALNSGAELRHAIDKLRLRPSTVSGGDRTSGDSSGSPGSRSGDGTGDGDGTGRTGDRPGGSTGGGSTLASPPPGTPQTVGPGGVANLDSPSADFSGSQPPPPYTAGPLPVTAAENALWQQVHTGPPEIREQALRDLAAARGAQPPGSTEIGVRDALHSDLSQRPEVRVVPAGNSPAARIDTDEVRRALDSFGVPVTVESPLPGDTASSADMSGGTSTEARPETAPTRQAPGHGADDGSAATGSPGATSPGIDSPGPATPDTDSPSPSTPDASAPAPVTPGTSSLGPAAPGTGSASPAAPGTGSGSSPASGASGARSGGVPTAGTSGAPSSPTPSQGSPGTPDAPQADGDTVDRQGVRDEADGVAEGEPGALTGPVTDPTGTAPRTVVVSDGTTQGEPDALTDPVTDPTGTTPRTVVVSDGATQSKPDALTGPAADPTGTAPLTVVVSESPPPAQGSPEAAALLDGAGADRAVVLGPPSTVDGAGRPVRAAVELTRGGPGQPVDVRPLTGPAPGAPDGTGGTVDTAFPGSNVLLPLADAVGSPAPAGRASRPATESAAVGNPPAPTSDTGSALDAKPFRTESVPSPADASPTEMPSEVRPPADSGATEPDAASSTAPPPATRPSTLSRPWAGPATEVHVESGNSPAPLAVSPPQGGLVARPVDATADAGAGPARRSPARPFVTTLTGHTVPVAHLRRWVPEAATQPQPGRAVRTLTVSQSPAEDGTAHSEARRTLLGQDTYRGVRTVSAPAAVDGASAPPRTVFTGPPAALPGSGTEAGADYVVAHGTPRTVTLGTDDTAHPGVKVSGVQFGEVLKSWSEDGAPDRPIVLFSCETGRQPAVAGLPVAQHVANRTGRPVFAPTTEVGTARDRDGNVRAVLTEGPDGPGRWRLFTPEPGGADLDDLARIAGLHAGPEPADAFTRARTLQQIRTLRDTLGTDAEQRPENHALLAGLALVDNLRWLSPSTAARYGDGRMTPDLLRRMVTDWNDPAGSDAGAASDPAPEQYTRFLRAAAGLRSTGGVGATLETLLPPPPPALPPTAMVSPADVRGLTYAPSAQITWSLSDTPLPLAELALSPEDSAELARRRPDLVPEPSRPGSPAEDPALFSTSGTTPAGVETVHADGRAFTRLDTPGGGDCLFRALLDSARSRPVPPAWAARNVAGLRGLLRDRIRGTELGTAAATAFPDPVYSVVDDLRVRALAGARDAGESARITDEWNRIARAVVTDGDPERWRQLLRDSDYPHLADVAPTPAEARRIGSGALVAAAAERPGLWASPFADLLPEALAHTLDLDLRLVRPHPQGSAGSLVTSLHPGGRSGTLHLAYNGTDHYDALIPEPAPLTPRPDPVGTRDTQAEDPVTSAPPARDAAVEDTTVEDTTVEDATGQDTTARDADGGPGSESPDRGDVVPLETQLERYRPARLLTGQDVIVPEPAPRTVTFADGSRLPTVLIHPDGDPGGATPGDRASRALPGGLFTGPGVVTLRSPESVAREILDGLPGRLRSQFDGAELLRMLTDHPGAFTAPRGARFVGREKSGVGHEMTVEAVPYHRWERFADVDGGTTRVDTMRRGQAGTAGGRSVGVGRRIAGGVSMGPPLNWLLKIGVSLGWTRRTDYAQGTQAYNQTEWRAHEGSHLHLDDVYYRVRVERVTEAPKADGPVGGGSRSAESAPAADPAPVRPAWRRTEVHAAHFAVRDGLGWRLPDDLTVPFQGPRRAPRTLTFPDGTEPRVTDVTGLHLVDPPEDVALAVSGARPGSSAHRTLVSYVRPTRLLGLFGRMTGAVAGPELTRGSGRHPLGHLIVERSVPHRATLVTESVKAEVRDLTQTTYQNERGHVRDTRFGVQVTAGPNHTLVGPETDVRLQGGPLVRADLTSGRGHHLGADAARKTTGRIRNHPMALYRVERTLMVRRPGEPASAARPVRVVSLDWMSTQDARRLAGWDSRTPGRTGPDPDAEPPVPWYLTREDPVHLGGQVRAEGFRPDRPRHDRLQDSPSRPQEPSPDAARQSAPQDPLRVFTDAVLDTLHRSYPSLFVPPLMLRHPRLARLWYGDGRLRTASHNDRQVREALNRPSLAQSLDELTTTGVPVTLTEDGKVERGHHTLVLRARLDDRRFETTMSERSLRNAVVGTEISGQGQQASVTLSGGVELGVSPRDHDKVPEAGLPRRTGNVTLGARYATTDQKATRTTAAVTHDHLTFHNGADLYSYRVELGATFEGHRRPRGWARLASFGILGAGVFVSRVAERPLFARGSETVGRVELAVPAAHGSVRYGPADPPPGRPAAPAAVAPAQRLPATEADQLLDGTRPLHRADPADRRLTERLLSAPHVVLGTEGGPRRQQLVQDVADRASGSSWHVGAPGAPVRTALRRAVANLSVASQLGQYLGPFGSRITGLTGAGPLQTHYLKAAIRGELSNLRVRSDPKPASLEATIGNERRGVGTAGSVSHATLGVQGAHMPLQQAPGQAAVTGTYSTALQYAWGRGRSIAQTLTRGRNTTLTFAGRMYLVVADAAETVAVRDRWTAAMGLAGTRAGTRISAAAGRLSEHLGRRLAPRRAAAALHRIRDAVMFHLPMQDAIETGLAPDGLGTATPRNLGGGYRVPGFLRGRRFPTHPSGRLDASRAARHLLGQLETIGVPSHDREQVLQRLSPDFLRAHLHELTTDGMTLPVRHRVMTRPHHLAVGGSPAVLHFRLTPVTTTVERLRTGFELEDYRTIARDDAVTSSQDRGADTTLGVSERAAAGSGGVLTASPALQGTAAKQRSSTRTETHGSTAMPNIATTQAHAEIVTSYVLTVSMTDTTGAPLAPRTAASVGTLNEMLPVSLLTPDGDGSDGAVTEQEVPEPERAVRMLTAEQARPEGIAAWRTSGDGSGESDVLPFDDRIGSGILAVDIVGAANVQDGLTLATARADGLGDGDLGRRHSGRVLAERVRMARLTPLTGLGTAPAQAQLEATSQGGLTAGFREALGPDGSVLPTQSSARLFGQSHTADSRLHAKMHRTGARLLAVENKPRMEAMQRRKTSDALESGITDNVEGTVGTSPLAGNSNAGVTNPGATVPIGGANDSTALKGTADTTLGTHLKVVTERSMLFALPVSWLSVSEVHHHVGDSRALHALGKARRGPRAAEARTTALVWLREDIARDYGLLDDTTFPGEVGAAWDDLAKATADLATAEQRYYDARARARDTWLDLTPREQQETVAGEPGTPPSSAAVAAWQAARAEVRLWEQRTDAAAAEHHRLHGAASRLTAHHRDPSTVPAPDPRQPYAPPAWRSEAPEPYTVTDATGSGPRTLTSPDGATVREIHDVPHDGASFFHALLAVARDRGRLPHLLGTDLAGRFTAAPGDPGVTAEAVGTARDRLAWALGEDGNADLLDSLALDTADTFTQAELDAAGVRFTPAQQAEFDAFGRLPQTFWPSPGQRVALAVAALARPFVSEPLREAAADPDDDRAAPGRRAGDHGGADLLPALAARTLGVPLTVVTGEGRSQLFLPHGGDPAAVRPATDPVLFTAGGFFHAALPPGTPPPAAAPLPRPTDLTAAGQAGTLGTTSAHRSGTPGRQQAPRPSHTSPPWSPPTGGTGPRYRLDRNGVLTAPDGATYTQGTPTGRGNAFFGALSTALRQAAAQPGLHPREAARLRTRAGHTPAQLMRLNGLPGTAAERDALFSPPPLRRRSGAPEPSQEALEGHLRRHLADAPWGPEADRAVAEWAASATGTTVTLIEENGTAHTYPGPAADGPHLRLRRRGGDFVPLLPQQDEAYELSTLSGDDTGTGTQPAAPQPVLRTFKLGTYEFTNLNQTDDYVDKAVRIVELLDEHPTIKDYVGGRTVRITLHLRTTDTPADVIDRGDDGVDINLASYYFEKYDTGYIMGMLAHEIGLHPLASRDTRIPEEEDLYRGMPLPVPGLESLKTPRFMNTEGAGQEDHVMAAFPHTVRHGIYRDIVVEMAQVLAHRAQVGVPGAKAKDVTDLIDTYLMDLASIAVTNDHRAKAILDPAYTARVYNAYKEQLLQRLPQDSPVRALLPADKGRFGVLGDFAQLATAVGTNNRGDSIQRPAQHSHTPAPPGEARPRLPRAGDEAAAAVPPRMPQSPNSAPPAPEPVFAPFTSGNFEFTNLKHTDERYRDKAIRIIDLLRRHATIRDYVGGRTVRITLHLRTTETPGDVIDHGDDGVDINLASYYFEKYDTGYIMGMLAHEIGLHPLASRDTAIPDEEAMFQGVPLTVPGLSDLKNPRTMNTEGAGQADHIMAAFPSSTRHRIYRDIVVDMARILDEDARAGEEGARSKDVTDLVDTYLMDLATIAVTNDRRKDAAWEPRYTAKVYNAYKEQFAARLAPDSPVRRLLPPDKSWYNVTNNFLGLGASFAFNNQGDSIQARPSEPGGGTTGEARPGLPATGGTAPRPHRAPASQPGRTPLDHRPRFVVRSGFDARRFTYDGEPVTDLTVRVALRGTHEQRARVLDRLQWGVHHLLNSPGHLLPNGDRLHVTVEHVDPAAPGAEAPHLTVELTGRDRAMDQNTWWTDAEPAQLVHELSHQLGLRDEYRDAGTPHRPHVPGSLLGALDEAPEDASLPAAGLRGRHLALLQAQVGDVTPRSPQGARGADPTWAEARTGTPPVPRTSVWVDPVSLPAAEATADGTHPTEVPALMPRSADPAPAAAQAPTPFRSGNFEFTNLKHTNERYRDKAVRIIELLGDHPVIRSYVGDRPVRITLHLRTTETPADVRDLGAEGVQINLASYYFEKYDIGYIMGMLAHEIGLHPLASRDTGIPDEESMFQDIPLPVPGLADLAEPRTMSTRGAGQADHIMAAFPSSTRHRIYREIVVGMAGILARQAQAGEEGARAADVTDLFDCYLMDLASIAITNDYRMNAAKEPTYTAKVYNAYKDLLRASLADQAALQALLPTDKSFFGVINDFRRIGTYLAINNRGDSIQPAQGT